MYTISTEGITVDISDENLEVYRKRAEDKCYDLDELLKSFARIDFASVVQLVKNKSIPEPQTIRMLDAHGTSVDGKLIYFNTSGNEQETDLVETWMEKHDGQYDVLYFSGCNPTGIELTPRKSAIVYSSDINEGREVFMEAINAGSGTLRVIPPI